MQSGERELGHNVRVGYFSQHRVEMLNVRHTVLESVLDVPEPVSEQTARTVLGSFLFRGDDVFKTVGVLSGGEKSRLALVKLLLYPPNLLAHGRADDPPRCRLDRCAHRRAQAVRRDAHFHQPRRAFHPRDRDSVLHINAGQLTPYAGDYQYYLDKSKATSERAALTAGTGLTNVQPL